MPTGYQHTMLSSSDANPCIYAMWLRQTRITEKYGNRGNA